MNENHSCEDEELVISPQESGNNAASNTTNTNTTNQHIQEPHHHISYGPIETFAEDDSNLMMMNDPYQSNAKQRDLMIFATNDEQEDGERNADLNDATELRKKFSSLEDGEVRDEEDEDEEDDDGDDIVVDVDRVHLARDYQLR